MIRYYQCAIVERMSNTEVYRTKKYGTYYEAHQRAELTLQRMGGDERYTIVDVDDNN
jgi:hypothetical protein